MKVKRTLEAKRLTNEKVRYRILKVKSEYWNCFDGSWSGWKTTEVAVLLSVARECGYKFVVIDPKVQLFTGKRKVPHFGFVASGRKERGDLYKKKKDS